MMCSGSGSGTVLVALSDAARFQTQWNLSYIKGKTATFFLFSSFYYCWIRDRNIRIRDKHPRSTTLEKIFIGDSDKDLLLPDPGTQHFRLNTYQSRSGSSSGSQSRSGSRVLMTKITAEKKFDTF
jgi:hypothetical protein